MFLFYFLYIEHNNSMIYFISFLCGIINGLFASLAGQIMIFYLVFILKKEAHISRASSVCAISIITVVSLIQYFQFLKFEIKDIIIVTVCGLIFGGLGAKLMNKIQSEWLNLISGIILTGLSIYKVIFN